MKDKKSKTYDNIVTNNQEAIDRKLSYGELQALRYQPYLDANMHHSLVSSHERKASAENTSDPNQQYCLICGRLIPPHLAKNNKYCSAFCTRAAKNHAGKEAPVF